MNLESIIRERADVLAYEAERYPGIIQAQEGACATASANTRADGASPY